MRGRIVTFLVIYSLQPALGQWFWDLGNIQYGGVCALNPVWMIPAACKTYNGTVGCSMRTGGAVGQCMCNLKDAAYFDDDSSTCLGKAGAPCTFEYSGFVPPKRCTPNADCATEANKGHSVGKCACVYGYKPNVMGLCAIDPDVEEGQRSTPRTTTTTESAGRPPFELPTYKPRLLGESCSKASAAEHLIPLNVTRCNTYRSTVACVENKCECNMGAEFALLDEDAKMCVGKVGSFCLANPSLLGYKVCTKGADCFPIKGSYEDYSFGTCKCLDGYNVTPEGTCETDDPTPATPRATTTRQPGLLPGGTSSENPVGDGGGNNDSGAPALPAGIISLLLATMFLFV